MSEELKGAVCVALFGFAIAAIAWLLPLAPGEGSALTARQQYQPQVTALLDASRADPPQVLALTGPIDEVEAPISPTMPAPRESAPRESNTGGLRCTYETKSSAPGANKIIFSIRNNTATTCDGMTLHWVAGIQDLATDALPAGCEQRDTGGPAIACTLPDLTAGETITVAFPLRKETPAEPAIRADLFAWVNGNAIVLHAVKLAANP